MPRLQFQSIVKTYGAVTVLDDLNLDVANGEFLVLLGPSGCGKTTLLNILAGLLDLTEGRILIDDRDVTDLDPKDRGLAMVFQPLRWPIRPRRSKEICCLACARKR